MKRGLTIVLVAACVGAALGAGTQPGASTQAAGTMPMSDVQLKAEVEKIQSKEWVSKQEMYVALAGLIKPGMTVAQVKIVLPAGMGMPVPATVPTTSPFIFDASNTYSSGFVVSTGGWYSMTYTLDPQYSVRVSGGWATGGPGVADQKKLSEFTLDDRNKLVDSGPEIVETHPAGK